MTIGILTFFSKFKTSKMVYYHTKIETFKNGYVFPLVMEDISIFQQALGGSPVIRVLDFLIEGRGLDYSLTDIAQNAEIGWTTLHRIWGDLERLQIVVFTREIGRAKLFKINEKNLAVLELIKLYDVLLYQESEKHLKKKIVIKT